MTFSISSAVTSSTLSNTSLFEHSGLLSEITVGASDLFSGRATSTGFSMSLICSGEIFDRFDFFLFLASFRPFLSFSNNLAVSSSLVWGINIFDEDSSIVDPF